jgi:hypothetical protein
MCLCGLQAFHIFQTATHEGHFRQDPRQCDVKLHGTTTGVALLTLLTWLREVRQATLQVNPASGSEA